MAAGGGGMGGGGAQAWAIGLNSNPASDTLVTACISVSSSAKWGDNSLGLNACYKNSVRSLIRGS